MKARRLECLPTASDKATFRNENEKMLVYSRTPIYSDSQIFFVIYLLCTYYVVYRRNLGYSKLLLLTTDITSSVRYVLYIHWSSTECSTQYAHSCMPSRMALDWPIMLKAGADAGTCLR